MKIWYLLLSGNKTGPYSFEDLKVMSTLTPDTLAWREGMDEWLQIRDIPELEELFKEKDLVAPSFENVFESKPSDDGALSLQNASPPFLFWVIVLIALVLLQLYYFSW